MLTIFEHIHQMLSNFLRCEWNTWVKEEEFYYTAGWKNDVRIDQFALSDLMTDFTENIQLTTSFPSALLILLGLKY